MALTNEQREEMRECVVGPCSKATKARLRAGFIEKGENVEVIKLWVCNPSVFKNVKYFHGCEDWGTTRRFPNISAKDFISKYLSNATK